MLVMKYKIAINGFGRIGRLTLRSILERKPKNIKIVAINDLGSLEGNLHLLKYDSIHGELKEELDVNGNKLKISDQEIVFLKESDPSKLNWDDHDVDLVIESTGFLQKRIDAKKHLDSGAKKF